MILWKKSVGESRSIFPGVLDGRRRTASLTLIILTVFQKTPAWFITQTQPCDEIHWCLEIHQAGDGKLLSPLVTPCFILFNTHQTYYLKPVLNWANICSPNILRTVRRTMISFLIELLVRRTWFGQFDELYFVLNWLVMRCKLRPELATDAQQTAWSKM